MARPKDANSAETFDKIVAAALAIVREQDAPTPPALRSVARRAGVSLGTIVYYFDDKGELLEACLDAFYNRLSELAAGMVALGSESDNRRVFLEQCVRRAYSFVCSERGLIRLRMATNASRGELHPRRQREYMGSLIAESAAALERFVDTDALDTRLSVQVVTSMIIRFALLSDSERSVLTGCEGPEGEAVIEEFIVRATQKLLQPTES